MTPHQTPNIGTLSDSWAEILPTWPLNVVCQLIQITPSSVRKCNIMVGILKSWLMILSESSSRENKKALILVVLSFLKAFQLSYHPWSESKQKLIKSVQTIKMLSRKKCQPGPDKSSKNYLNLSEKKCSWEMMIIHWPSLKFKPKNSWLIWLKKDLMNSSLKENILQVIFYCNLRIVQFSLPLLWLSRKMCHSKWFG